MLFQGMDRAQDLHLTTNPSNEVAEQPRYAAGDGNQPDLMTESFAQLFEESLNKIRLQSGELITGEVVHVDENVVVVNAGLKSEAVIPVVEFQDVDYGADIVQRVAATYDRAFAGAQPGTDEPGHLP